MLWACKAILAQLSQYNCQHCRNGTFASRLCSLICNHLRSLLQSECQATHTEDTMLSSGLQDMSASKNACPRLVL